VLFTSFLAYYNVIKKYLKYGYMRKHSNTAKIKKEIGRRVRQARIEAGYSQEALGKELGLTHGAVGSYERGRLNITIQLLLLLCQLLKKPLSYFIINENDETLAAEEAKRLAEEAEMKKKYSLDDNLEFTIEMSLRTYFKSKGMQPQNISSKIEKIMKYIEKQAD
jgi:transcriptional regulator with XRE-family HTH domain